MNRRSFMQSILATAAAPYVVTTAGVLMPVRQIISPARSVMRIRLTGSVDRHGRHITSRTISTDGGVTWRPDSWLSDERLRGILAGSGLLGQVIVEVL